MTNQSNFQLDNNFQARLREALAAAEGPPKTSIPRSGDSGVSVGSLQLDLAKQEAFRWQLIDAGVLSGAIKDDADALVAADRLLQSTNKSLSAAQRNAVETRARELVNGILATPAGRDALQSAERSQLANVERAVQRVCGQAGPQARAFCNSRQGQLEIASYLHQFGANDTRTIEAYVRGETVTLGRGAEERQVRIQGTLDAEQFRGGYQGSTLWGQTERTGLNTRHDNIDRFLRQQNIDDGSRARINPGQRSEAAPAELAPAQPLAQQHASLADEGAREQSANIVAGSGQPLVQRTTWNPDPAALQEAMASLRVDDLPVWTKNLLGRDVLANGAKPAVMGFQRAINAATKPPGWDYKWSLGVRTGRIDVDGDLGPQTRAGFGRAVEKQGEDGFKKLYALDQFGRYVKNVDRGRAKLGDLEDTVAGTLGQAIPDAPERAQETLNMLAEDREEPGAPLKIDGWVGPKTTEAFGTLLRKTSPDALTARFAGKDFWEDENLA
jgi:hypothetical protein